MRHYGKLRVSHRDRHCLKWQPGNSTWAGLDRRPLCASVRAPTAWQGCCFAEPVRKGLVGWSVMFMLMFMLMSSSFAHVPSQPVTGCGTWESV